MKRVGNDEAYEFILFVNNTQFNGIAKFYKCVIFSDDSVIH